jgi:hypothetical protein
MNTVRLAAALLVLTLLAGCASATSKPARTEFEDIPIPRGLTFQSDRSTIIESPTVKAARLVYRGRLELQSLAMAWRTTLEANGWRHVSSTSVQEYGITQVYEKAGTSLAVRLWEGWIFTYAELTVGRAIPSAK